jgi:CubicO group peptidase (beta-lactamase class C family)
MTAYLAAMFVDSGQLSFETKILSVFPEMVTSADPGYQDVTVAHLLAHRAGLNDDELIAAYGDDLPDTLALPDQRAWVVEKVLSTPPSNVGNYAYSNLGYILAGAILERRSGNSWEDLIQTRLFEPLGMDSAGFGPPGTPGALDQPWGHQLEGTQIIPSQIDNPKIYGPAGRVHCSIGDWAKFIQEFMNCLRGETALVSAANCEKIATPWPGGDYGFGWQVVSTNGVTVLLHDGSNDYFYSLAVVNPAINTAILAATNIGGDRGALAVNAVIQELAGRVDQD